MQEITSVNNDLVKQTVKLQQKKYRDKENKFLLEGMKCIEEAYQAGVDIEYVFVLKEKAELYKYLGEKIIITTESVLKKISTTDSAPDAVGVAFKKIYSTADLKNVKKVVLLELGVGFNTPIIIRFPFEKMVRENLSYSLIRLNMDEAVVPESFGERAIGIGDDMAKAITDIRGLVL